MSNDSSKFREIGSFGRTFKLLIGAYQNMLESDYSKTPPWMLDLLGDRIIPSFVIYKPDGSFEEGVGRKGTPFNIGKVVEQLHVALRGAMIDYKINPEELPPASVKTILDRESTKKAGNEFQDVPRAGLHAPDAPMLFPPELIRRLNAISMEVVDEFAKLKTFTMHLQTRGKNPRHLDITIPNRVVRIKQYEFPEDIKARLCSDAPLAAIAWALSRARMHVMGDEYSYVLQFILGNQSGNTMHMHLLNKAIQMQLPEGVDVKDFLCIDENQVKRVITEHSHHLSIAATYFSGVLDTSERGNGFEEILKLAYQTMPEVRIGGRYASRDTALMLDAVSRVLGGFANSKEIALLSRTLGFSGADLKLSADCLRKKIDEVWPLNALPEDQRENAAKACIASDPKALESLQTANVFFEVITNLIPMPGANLKGPIKTLSEFVAEISRPPKRIMDFIERSRDEGRG